jgi:hypothetical protein
MKKNLLFIVGILLLFVAMYQINRSRPAQFVWEPTFRTEDKQPYGAYALDKLLKASWEEEYIHTYENVSDLYDEETLFDKNLLIVCNNFNIPEYQLDDFLQYIEEGGNAMVVAGVFSQPLMDTLHFSTDYRFNWSALNLSLEYTNTKLAFCNSSSHDSISGIPQSMVYNFFIPEPDTESNDSIFGEGVSMVATDSKNHAVMIRYKIGEGNLILSCTPLLFTNYAVLSDSIHPFITNSLSLLKGKPLIRTEYYEVDLQAGENPSIFRYLLSQPSLKWAFYLVLVSILLFMIFTAKRKQKAIPIIKPPENKMVDFVRSIASLYLSQNNNADIVLKKYIYWGEELRRNYGIDIINEFHDKAFIKQFSAKTGLPEEEAKALFLNLDGIREHTVVSNEEMIDLVTKMKI